MTDLFSLSPPLPGADIQTSIIDNQGDNSLRNRLRVIGDGSQEVSIASAFFSLDGLMLLADVLAPLQKVRILFGDDAEAKQRVQLLRLLRQRSDDDLLEARDETPTLAPLHRIEALFQEGKFEARCYTAKKFHAKAYLFRYPGYRSPEGVLGSGNFTRAGLTQNVELNVRLTGDQNEQLSAWFEERWNEAHADVVTEDLLKEVRRQIELYDPYVLYLKALYAWGESVQDNTAQVGPKLADVLDPHQEIAFRQAVRILDNESGVMVCDGVGLGKSFVALALMEQYCRRNKTVLLVAPKSVLVSSWQGYLQTYMEDYTGELGTMLEKPMTWFGFDGEKAEFAPGDAPNHRHWRTLQRLAERADVIVVDESHNFRTPSASRFQNLFRLIAPQLAGKKKVILLTATPINTAYADLSAQVSLMTHNEGDVNGYGIAQIRKAAANLDKAARDAKNNPAQLPVQLSLDSIPNEDVLRRVLESVVIQRSRKTCRELAASAGKELRFPRRRDPQCLEYRFDMESEAYTRAIALAELRFREAIEMIKALGAAQRSSADSGKKYDPFKVMVAKQGYIKLAAFLPEQYRRRSEERNTKADQLEIHLAKLVYTNALKQLESSPVAFQGILQSLAKGLLARLRFVLGDAAQPVVAQHQDWVNLPLFETTVAAVLDLPEADDTEDDIAEDGDVADASGTETDNWVQTAIADRGLAKKLAGFSDKTHEVKRWSDDIVSDLKFLQEIHAVVREARAQPDPKLAQVTEVVRDAVGRGERVLVFSQSQRTAEYVERELKARLGETVGIARVDSRVEKPRKAILYAFCPGYNAKPDTHFPSVPERVDVLISTDVLAEGVNLQETGTVINYDIHWNPVRLIQRIGRVDRRLNPAITPETHAFSIVNVVPPDDIEKIIDLVGRIEERTIKISRTLGLETSFFKATDDAGTLKEFNAEYEGASSDADDALNRYVSLTTAHQPDPATQALVDQIPPGAFGVWNNAPQSGVFALLRFVPKRTATDADREKFAAFCSRPVLAFLPADATRPLTDAVQVLRLLEPVPPSLQSVTPADEELLKDRLSKLKSSVRQSARTLQLPSTIALRVECWMELRA